MARLSARKKRALERVAISSGWLGHDFELVGSNHLSVAGSRVTALKAIQTLKSPAGSENT